MKKKELLQRVIDLEKEVELLKDKISAIMKNNSAPCKTAEPDPWIYSRPLTTWQVYPKTCIVTSERKLTSGG